MPSKKRMQSKRTVTKTSPGRGYRRVASEVNSRGRKIYTWKRVAPVQSKRVAPVQSKRSKSKASKRTAQEQTKRRKPDTRGCTLQTSKKYASRLSPPYPANQCCNSVKRGNDGNLWQSRQGSRACTWQRI